MSQGVPGYVKLGVVCSRPAGGYNVLMQAHAGKVRPVSRINRPIVPVPPIREQASFHAGGTIGETKKRCIERAEQASRIYGTLPELPATKRDVHARLIHYWQLSTRARQGHINR